MPTKWFGKPHPAPAYEADAQIETPAGATCCHCAEPVLEGDDGWVYANGPVAHRECFIRQIVGSVAHQQRRCSCYVPDGGNQHDDPALTPRQAAQAALDYWERPKGKERQS